MERGTWRATVHGVTRIGHDLVTKPRALKVKVAQLCSTLCDPEDYTVHGILQARILERVAFPFSRGSSQPRDQTQVSHVAGVFFTSWATREARGITFHLCAAFGRAHIPRKVKNGTHHISLQLVRFLTLAYGPPFIQMSLSEDWKKSLNCHGRHSFPSSLPISYPLSTVSTDTYLFSQCPFPPSSLHLCSWHASRGPISSPHQFLTPIGVLASCLHPALCRP